MVHSCRYGIVVGRRAPKSNEHGSARMGADMYEEREEPKRWRMHMSNASLKTPIDTVSRGAGGNQIRFDDADGD